MESIEQVFIKQEPQITEYEENHIVETSTKESTLATEIKVKIENIENDENGSVTESDNSNVKETQHRISEEFDASTVGNSKTTRVNCPKCQTTFKNRGNLMNHLKFVHATVDEKRPCNKCGRTFKSIAHLRTHNYSVHANVNEQSCEICGKKFPNKKKLNNHLFYTHPKQENVICAVCSKVFQNKYRLKLHIRTVHPEGKNVICEQCNKEFKSDLLLRKHIQWSHPSDGMSHRCKECGKLLPSMICYEKHLKNVHGLGNIKCKDCNKLFQTTNNLNRHIKTFHQAIKVERTNKSSQKTKSSQHECDKCDKKFSTITALIWHQDRTHTDNKSDTNCLMCFKEFSDRGGLKRHLKSVHSMETATCNLCSKTFKSGLSLQRHVSITHAPPEAAKTCEICQKTFKSAIHLKIHIYAVHPKEGSVSCVICNKQFSSIKYLMKHEKTHNNIKEYPCHICGNYYKSAYDVRRHIKRVHMKNKTDNSDIEKRTCLKCGLQFCGDNELHSHVMLCGSDEEVIMKIEIEEESVT